MDIKDDETLLGAVEHLIEIKNHKFLIDLVHTLRNEGFKVKLLIIGEGDKREELLEQCKKLGIEDYVILFGASDEVQYWLSAMDYFLMPSLSEGLGISAVEAQANGLICLLSDRMPIEINLTETVFHLSIDHGFDEWVKALCDCDPRSYQERVEACSVIKQAGFDESSTSTYEKMLYGL